MTKRMNDFSQYTDGDIKSWVNKYHITGKPRIYNLTDKAVHADDVVYEDDWGRVMELFDLAYDHGYDALRDRLYRIFLDDALTPEEEAKFGFAIEWMYKARERARGNVIV